MRYVFFLSALALSGNVSSQTIQWEKSFGGSSTEIAFKVTGTTDGGYLIAGTTESNNGDLIGNHGSSDIWLLKLNSAGVKQWQKCLGGMNADGVSSLERTASGGYILAGNTMSNGAKNSSQVFGNRGNQDIWIVNVDSNGEIEWRQCYGGCDRDDVRAIRQASDGNFLVVGGTLSDNTGEVFGAHGNWDAWMLKIDPAGALLWQKTIGGSGIDYFYDIAETSNGNLILSGLTSSVNEDLAGNINKGVEDVWIAQCSPIGDLIWSKTFGGSDYDGARGMCLATDNSIMVVGVTYSSDGDVTGFHGGNDVWVLRLDAFGDLLWQKTFGGSDNESGFSIFQRTDNDFILSGETSSFDGDIVGNHGGTDALVMKIDKNGNLKTQICLGGSDQDFARNAIKGNASEIIVGGTSNSEDGDVSQNFGSSDIWVVNLGITLGLKPESPNAEDFRMNLIPNPANDLVQIVTDFSGFKQVEIFDAGGQLIQSHDMDGLNKTIQVGSLPVGMFLVRLVVESGQVFSAKFVKE
ncbi:MAG: T9SS type A sorting domain-containing protein [Saprospiraceae bacterium]|nr:T9SS type A sorting domain-containing protein [Saprospiraceae bacterium]